jgi:ubiquinone/menaquinone biosynthesis C-methylase UbiE
VTDFDKKAAGWDSDPRRAERARAVAEGIRASVPLHPGMRALEYGCGTGLLSFALRAELGPITLADSSPGMLAVLAEKIAAGSIRNMTPLRLDLAIDPLPRERFDFIYTLMTLHHVADTAKLLKDFYELLEAQGFLCIADLDKEDGSFHGLDFQGHKGFNREELRRLAARAGFREAAFTTVFHVTRETEEGKRVYPVFLMTARKDQK